MCRPMPRSSQGGGGEGFSMFRERKYRVGMTGEAERLPMASRIRKKEHRIRTGDDNTPLGGPDLGHPIG
jgi:hypothetical protein